MAPPTAACVGCKRQECIIIIIILQMFFSVNSLKRIQRQYANNTLLYIIPCANMKATSVASNFVAIKVIRHLENNFSAPSSHTLILGKLLSVRSYSSTLIMFNV